jgi:hypothetical protein
MRYALFQVVTTFNLQRVPFRRKTLIEYSRFSISLRPHLTARNVDASGMPSPYRLRA